ncbi:glycosyl hydrolase 115 family protein [Aestuariibaculum sp. YM273]|uniref:glycosyl hydrolase 115 family protein n=1 Tax=Aestuariibaculum sp. YM273 TaxID=3070659 RepID=UPI0027DD1378|nr:glycosyl hydrolase 115 family protein [Aestuariibaculum sp. YM273]WMI66295.1 glycosyl hydrolase 115 family protein [Aestuariibaculum sp. YM273]
MKLLLKNILFFLSLILLACGTSMQSTNNQSAAFEIYTQTKKTVILYDKASPLDSITSNLLAEDIFKVTNYKPEVITNIDDAKGHVIVIGALESELINQFLSPSDYPLEFKNQWESYQYKTVSNSNKNIEKAFIIAGTQPRGTAYGVFNLSKQIGVNPWYWWADIPAKKQSELIIKDSNYFSKEPSVKFRGIFLNDEDWGLQPWAAKTFEPETGDIGPKTYSKIFELLLRLNANAIWPAMHPSTKAFFHYPGNAKMAELYNIVIGTSHAEPMLRNNLDEWNKTELGRFDYKNNKNTVYNYWENRVKAAKNIDAIYTMGMRGVHDSGMEGVKSKDEAVDLLDGIIKDQRGLLEKYINSDASQVPQAFTVYKEVLDLYKNGLEVPEDITLVWTDDNYGYIRSLSDTEEQQRSGGGGVYYHASYWGRPHDYLWLSTTSPHLIWEEMMKAYTLNNKTIWILNVGDIKPAEYNTQLFLDMAYDASQFEDIKAIAQHQEDFFTDIFGEEKAKTIAKIKETYYHLAFERKPEFMGWSQTEPTTQIHNTDYTAFSFGDEISNRIATYEAIENQVQNIEQTIPENLKSSFVQLVSYPVEAASNMNKKFLYRDKALTYAKQGRKSAETYKLLANQAYENIVSLTEKYNALSNGKWNGIMHMKPRNLPVYQNPEIELNEKVSKDILGVSVEDTLKTSEGRSKLPTFYANDSTSHFIDVYLKSKGNAKWTFKNVPEWLNISESSGFLNFENSLEDRIFVSIDWDSWKQSGKPLSEVITIEVENFKKDIQINISESYSNLTKNSIIEKNGLAIWHASSFSNNVEKNGTFWKSLQGLGHSQNALQAWPLASKSFSDYKSAPVLEYHINTETITNEAFLTVNALPTHPLTTNGTVKVAVQWNNEPVEIIDFKTKGRSNTWKQNVLSNTAKKQIPVPIKYKGEQTLKIYMIDAGVTLDYFILNTSKNKIKPYHLGTETKL